MALWIQNITPDNRPDDRLHLYKVAIVGIREADEPQTPPLTDRTGGEK